MKKELSIATLKNIFSGITPEVDFCSLRYVKESGEMIQVRQDVLLPLSRYSDAGVMITVIHRGGLGYAGTSDLSEQGLQEAVNKAVVWADYCAGKGVIDFSTVPFGSPVGEYRTPVEQDWKKISIKDKIDLLIEVSEGLKIDNAIVDWNTSLWQAQLHTIYLTNRGGEIIQDFSYVLPDIQVTANKGIVTQNRSLGGGAFARQEGMEILDNVQYTEKGKIIAEEALELLSAPNCPSGPMDLLLDPDQMILQIHESIGHPLELDRILGDERNYAGTSFVTPEMFGTYEYGSPLLNITFDPTITNQLASYGYDDDGEKAEKKYIIEKGILKRGLGSIVSQKRSGIPGVANSRAEGWNRPPIDRMANLNLEPGDSTMDDMIGSVEKGIYMKTNCSWSIDDSRNKFQFGCEWARLIENGRLTTVVKNPNYRGISAIFWRNLKMVGNKETFTVMGTPNCGKGEPNQIMRVGHASPACLFHQIEVFGGE